MRSFFRLPLWVIALISLSASTLAVAVLPAEPAVAAMQIPSGFAVETIPTPLGVGGSYKLTDFEYIPPASGVEGGIIAAGKDGNIAWVSNDGTSRILGKVPNVRQVGDNGLVGLTPAIDYATSRRVYVVYNRPGTTHNYGMLSVWRVDSVAHPTSITWERHVIDGSLGSWLDDGPNHQVGDVFAWPDGSLFVSQGDGVEPATANATALWALDNNDPHGKIFHILPDGKGAPDNPYYDAAQPSSWKSRVFASGVRNGFRLWRDAASGRLMSSIVGWDSTEMVASIPKGANFGWPCWEGTIKTPGYSAMGQCQQLYANNTAVPSPFIWTYPHNGLQASVTGGVTYAGTTYPAAYRNKTFVGDFARQELWMFGTDGQQLTSAPVRLATAIGNNTAVHTCQNGDICWTDIKSNNIFRLRYGLANRAPAADFNVAVDSATKTATFDASASYDPEGDPLRYAWQFGDGATGAGSQAVHQYANAGPFEATLTVYDGLDNSGEFSVQVWPANAAPKLTLHAPSQANFAVGDPIALSASVTDPEDGTLNASQISWQLTMLHCPFQGPCHPHPSDATTGSAFSAVFPDHGGDTKLVFTLTSPPDSKGVSSTLSYTAAPRLRVVKITAPSGVTATVNGDVTNTINVVAKAVLALAVPATSSAGTFQKWSDGNTSATRQLTMPDADLSLTAMYGNTSLIDQRYQAMGGVNSWLGAPTGDEFSVGSGRQRNYKWGSLYWSSSTGVHFVKGAIRTKYQALGGPAVYGFPTTDETSTAGGSGAFNNFKDGKSIYWTSSTGAHEVHGGIYKTWRANGGETGRLGFPTSDEFTISIGRRSNFQKGYITWDKTTGVTKVVLY